jgi:hypothetical protein
MVQHKTLHDGRWQQLSLLEQLGNVGGEVHRAALWKKRGDETYRDAVARALELLDLTIQDTRWRSRLREPVRARELLVDAMYGGKEYGSTLEDLDRYFFQFALAARIKK